MPAPSSTTYSAAAKTAAQTALLGLIDGGSGAGKVKFYTSADALLGTQTLTDPAGTVNSGTGVLSLTPATSSTNASATGTVAYATITDSADTVIVSAPAQAGSTPVTGYVVINTLSFVGGSPFSLVSATIG